MRVSIPLTRSPGYGEGTRPTEVPLLTQLKAIVRTRASLGGMAFGAVYGLFARLIVAGGDGGQALLGGAFLVMSLAFLFVVPAVIGIITVSAVEQPSGAYRVFAPWVPVLLTVAVAVLIGP